MAVRWTPGAVLKVGLADGRYAYAVMLGDAPYIAFFPMGAELERGVAPAGDPLFVVGVQRNAYSRGGWGKPVAKLAPEDVPPTPRFFRQDRGTVDSCVIIEPGGDEHPATPAECAGLERAAVWADNHVVSRLEDHNAGRPNGIAERMRLET